MVERDTLMQRLPRSQRTWIPFKSGAYSGANMFLLSGTKVLPALETLGDGSLVAAWLQAML